MRKFTTTAIVIACILAAVAAFFMSSRSVELQHEGHPLTYWLDQPSPIEMIGNQMYWIHKAHPKPLTDRAEPVTDTDLAISALGTNTLPFLLSCIRYEPKPSTSRAKRLLRRLPRSLLPASLRQWLGENPTQRAETAAIAFRLLGAKARPAIPDLAKILNDTAATNASRRAAFALAQIGTEALPVLIARLRNTNAPGRYHVLHSIYSMPGFADNCTEAAPAIILCLQDKDPKARDEAATMLTQLNLPAELAVPAFTNCLSASLSSTVRPIVMLSLTRYPHEARCARPLLVAALQDPSTAVRKIATDALSRIEPDPLTNAPAR